MTAIYLIGPRACGKTVVGRNLAESLKLSFLDTDAYLCGEAGRTVAEIIKDEGWEGFRQRESAALGECFARYLGRGGVVIATGGGIVLAEENRAFMRETGTVFFLSAPAKVLAARLAANPDAALRPSLTGRDVAEEVATVLAERLPLYGDAAHHVLDASAPVGVVCANILKALQSRHS
jgi:shikimate kinase